MFELHSAIQAGNWEQFSASASPKVLRKEDGVNERLGNIFFEREVFSQNDLRTDQLKLSDWEREKLTGDYESGRTGMVLAASFINSGRRSEGDFSRAYGDQAWRGFVRAHTHLASIPKGALLENLSLDVIQETNRLIHAPDKGLKASLLRTVSAVGRGGTWDEGGQLRTGRQFARPEKYSASEVAALEEAGVKVMPVAKDVDGSVKAMLEYPPPEEVKPRIEQLIAELKQDLSNGADPIMAASRFQRHLVALHPFGDSNGRTSRVLMNRILAEYDLPPAIFRDQNKDVSLSPEAWRTEVATAVGRTKKFLGEVMLESKDKYLAINDIQLLAKSPDQPIVLDGNPFDVGVDGMLYDPTGRPWVAQGEEIVPLSQLDHYFLARRIIQLGKDKGTESLRRLTESNLEVYEKVSSDPTSGEKFSVRPEGRARTADSRYRLSPEPEVAKLLTELSQVKELDPATLFTIADANGTPATSTLSRYAQVDLEFWYLEQGLREGNFPDLAENLRGQREQLFVMAKEQLSSLKDASRVSPENPNGFQYRYEQMMFEASPLRFNSFDEALRTEGDQKLTVWRGDYSFARLIGMAPNNDVRQPDAKSIARERAMQNQLTNLYDDLVKLEGSAIGRQYICTTSDLSLLAKSFANTTTSQFVRIGGLPEPIKAKLFAWMDPDHGTEGMSDADKAARRQQAVERGDSVVPAEFGGKEIKDVLGIPGTIVTVKVIDREAGTVEVSGQRKAFKLVLDKDALLPGIYALGGPSFVAEQEVHGLERVYPWHIKGTYTAESLNEEFPTTSGP